MIYRVTLNGKVYEVEVEKGEAMIKSEFDAAVPTATPAPAPQQAPAAQPSAPASAAGGNANSVVAPMPGNINAVKVATGQAVKKGDVLVILEAMKMENEIVAPKDGKVGQIFVQKGATVSTGAPLVEVL
ncbi:MAG: biotin/lipoyl-binding protein [Clostridia bacterium]|nr:biotin/lipoyl-binding protein [Clostridia bacterium]